MKEVTHHAFSTNIVDESGIALTKPIFRRKNISFRIAKGIQNDIVIGNHTFRDLMDVRTCSTTS